MPAAALPKQETYPIIGDLIRTFPELFSKTELIGIFEGTYGVSSFLLNANYIQQLDLYENFSFTRQKTVIDSFKKMYDYWEEQIPNLKVHIKEGSFFIGNSNFTLIDVTQNLNLFLLAHKHKLKKTLCVSPGFMENFGCTKNMIEATNKKELYPVLWYRDYLFYTTREKRYDYTYNKIKEHILQNYECNIIEDTGMPFIQILNCGIETDVESFESKVSEYK